MLQSVGLQRVRYDRATDLNLPNKQPFISLQDVVLEVLPSSYMFLMDIF